MQDAGAVANYLRGHFWTLAELSAATGLESRRLEALIAAGCLPRHSYELQEMQMVTGVIGGVAVPLPGPSVRYYSRALHGWALRAQDLARTLPLPETARQLRAQFQADFAAALLRDGDAHRHGWAHLFSAPGRLDTEAVAMSMDAIWENWTGGLYGCCLRQFDGYHLVTKIVERARIQELTSMAERPALPTEARSVVVAAIARLDSVLLPFSPHERAGTTRGKWIDTIVAAHGLAA